MKESEINNKVSQLLHEFEAMDTIQSSSDYNEKLMAKINAVERNSSNRLINLKYSMVIVLFVLINVGFVYSVVNNGAGKKNERNTELQVIAKELLFNPNSQNN